MPNQDFSNAQKLPPYIFGQINALKHEARLRGDDIIDFGMGNPDQPTPNTVVDKLIETVKNPVTHRYSQSAGLPKLRLAIKDWYLRRYNVELDQDSEIVTCMGSKEGIAHLSLATLSKDDSVIVQSPTYPIHSYGVVIAGANVHSVTLRNDTDKFLNDVEEAINTFETKPKMIIINFPSNPTTQSVSIDFFEKIVKIGKKYDIWVIHDLALFRGYLGKKGRHVRADVENLIDNLSERGRLALLMLTETTALADPLESMEAVGQVAVNRMNTNDPDFDDVTSIVDVLKQRSTGRGSGSKMFQFDGLEPTSVKKRLTEIMGGGRAAIDKIYSAADNVISMNPRLGGDNADGREPAIPLSVLYYFYTG